MSGAGPVASAVASGGMRSGIRSRGGIGAVPRTTTIHTAPVVLFEILSEGTEHTDRFVKLREYCAIPAARRYVLVEQDQALLTLYVRTSAGWMLDYRGAGQVLDLPEVGIEIRLHGTRVATPSGGRNPRMQWAAVASQAASGGVDCLPRGKR